MFPQIQAKVHEEMDRVIGPDRLPTHQDREDLPYLNAVLKELYRWLVVVPMGEIQSESKLLLRSYVFSVRYSPCGEGR